MAVLAAGGEDFDFMGGSAVAIAGYNGSSFRAGYARHSLTCNNGIVKSQALISGPVTSCWLTLRMYVQGTMSTGGLGAGGLLFGLTHSSTSSSGIWVTTDSATGKRATVGTYDGATFTVLATEAGSSWSAGSTLYKLDLQIINYGASGTINFYINGALVITYTGDLRISGLTNLNTVMLAGWYGDGAGGFGGRYVCFSEIVVADDDTRTILGLVTMAPTGAGTTDQWAGAFTDVNETTVNDSNMISTNTPAQDEQFNITDMPAGNFAIKAVVPAVRAMITAGATVTKVALGFNSGGTVAVGTPLAVTTGWSRLSQVFTLNPVTSVGWLTTEMNALQLNLRSGT